MGAQLGNAIGVTDKRATQGVATQPIATPANYASEAALDARLTAISGTTYTAAVLRRMTFNDKVFAVRSADDAAGI
jgi:hypothetical protein